MIAGVDHIGIAVKNIDEAMSTYKVLFNVSGFHRESVVEQGVDIASFVLNGVRIELTAPLNDESPIAKFIANRGEGIHHIAFTSTNIDDDLRNLSDNGIRLINQEPVRGAHDMNIAFIHPKSTGGVLMELCAPNTTT